MSDEIRRVVTPLHSIAEQVGNNILATLNDAETSGVLTSIVPGFPQDQIVSIPLTVEQIQMIHSLLQAHQLEILQQPTDEENDEDERQIGFQISETDSEELSRDGD
jgi:hypothetical protein